MQHVNKRLCTKVFCLLTMLFVCKLACYQKLKSESEVKSFISHEKKVSHKKSVFSLQVTSFQSYNREMNKKLLIQEDMG